MRYLAMHVMIVLILSLALVAAMSAPSSAQDGYEYQQAMDLLAKHEYENAASLLREVAAAGSPTAVKAQCQLGQCYLDQKLLDQAIEAFNKGIGMVELPRDRAALHDLYFGLVAAYIEAKLWDYAAAAIQSMRTENPEYAKILEYQYRYSRGDTDQALQTLTDVIAAFPNSRKLCKAFREAPVLLSKGGKPREAKAMLQRLYDEDPDWKAEALWDMGSLAQTYEKNYDGALKSYDRFLKEFPDHKLAGAAKFHKAILALRYKKDAASARTLLSGLSGSKESPQADIHFYLGECNMQIRDLKAAAAEYARAYEADKAGLRKGQAKYLRGLCNLTLGDTATAKTCFAEVKAKFPGSEWAVLADARTAQIDKAASRAGQEVRR